MKKCICAVIAVILGASAMLASPPKKAIPLVIGGDTAIVVKTLPCTVTAPAGADLYFWKLPAGVVASGDENVLTVTAAPSGDSTIGVTSITFNITVDKDGKVTKTKISDTGSIVLTNGLKPPAPPTPADPFTASLQTAYNADTDTDRAASLAFLVSSYKLLASQAPSRTDLATSAAFIAWAKTVVQAPAPVGLGTDKLKTLRTAIAAEYASAWGTTSAPLTPANAQVEFAKIANGLAGVR